MLWHGSINFVRELHDEESTEETVRDTYSAIEDTTPRVPAACALIHERATFHRIKRVPPGNAKRNSCGGHTVLYPWNFE
jgi:hypothetical protein